MKKNKILNKVYKQKLKSDQAYDILYNPLRKLPKSRFVSIKIQIREHWFLSSLIGIFTILPVHSSIISFFLKRMKDTNPDGIRGEDLIQMIRVKGIKVQIISKDAYIHIKTI
ncbi:Uncharacterised protein [Acholeplasma oculi]|uniref:Uncharacterized protein n=1 Tax=Acholeplasma oculi TaxID=35623 RepID=A0A061AHW4_9MOLU|nr:hypothetical protein [Acholeplasma oculi]CDR30562.1 hypothetical protein Aocu_04890 [Acholeplasma oculi]SKC47046.1 hypothetical protein SAMN02745122_1262 [Acholeplasma oculi]SUT89246.1 Uncharacterised protein [Acholeplasma oculi]